jgi:hypothetical protein
MKKGASSGSVHRLGDGWHELPVHAITCQGLHRQSSEPCILLHFAIWAHRRGFDPESIYAKAYPGEGMLRADELLLFRQWTEVPKEIDSELLLRDLEDINQHELVKVIKEIEAGEWHPEEAYTHWVVTEDGRKAGEARNLDPPETPDEQGQHFCYVRLFAMPEMAEWGYTNASNLRPKREFLVEGLPGDRLQKGGA